MEVKKAHCFFEQSGTFKNEFIKLGIPAEDYGFRLLKNNTSPKPQQSLEMGVFENP